jgi:hypothetical protein
MSVIHFGRYRNVPGGIGLGEILTILGECSEPSDGEKQNQDGSPGDNTRPEPRTGPIRFRTSCSYAHRSCTEEEPPFKGLVAGNLQRMLTRRQPAISYGR